MKDLIKSTFTENLPDEGEFDFTNFSNGLKIHDEDMESLNGKNVIVYLDDGAYLIGVAHDMFGGRLNIGNDRIWFSSVLSFREI